VLRSAATALRAGLSSVAEGNLNLLRKFGAKGRKGGSVKRACVVGAQGRLPPQRQKEAVLTGLMKNLMISRGSQSRCSNKNKRDAGRNRAGEEPSAPCPLSFIPHLFHVHFLELFLAAVFFAGAAFFSPDAVPALFFAAGFFPSRALISRSSL